MIQYTFPHAITLSIRLFLKVVLLMSFSTTLFSQTKGVLPSPTYSIKQQQLDSIMSKTERYIYIATVNSHWPIIDNSLPGLIDKWQQKYRLEMPKNYPAIRRSILDTGSYDFIAKEISSAQVTIIRISQDLLISNLDKSRMQGFLDESAKVAEDEQKPEAVEN